MNVSELINSLKNLHPEAEVIIREGNFLIGIDNVEPHRMESDPPIELALLKKSSFNQILLKEVSE